MRQYCCFCYTQSKRIPVCVREWEGKKKLSLSLPTEVLGYLHADQLQWTELLLYRITQAFKLLWIDKARAIDSCRLLSLITFMVGFTKFLGVGWGKAAHLVRARWNTHAGNFIHLVMKEMCNQMQLLTLGELRAIVIHLGLGYHYASQYRPDEMASVRNKPCSFHLTEASSAQTPGTE